MLWLERIAVEDREEFDEWLASEFVWQEPQTVDPEQADLLEAFGLRRPA